MKTRTIEQIQYFTFFISLMMLSGYYSLKDYNLMYFMMPIFSFWIGIGMGRSLLG